jgi:hypothetical protein
LSASVSIKTFNVQVIRVAVFLHAKHVRHP